MTSTTEALLREWGDALLAHQCDHPSPGLKGGLLCPACARIHGRSADSVYPLLALARMTGESRYVDAAVALMRWSENVSRPDGAWINDVNINPWHGITVFGAIALAEALRHHADLLDTRSRHAWFDRLGRAAEFLHERFDPRQGNINYMLTLPYALELCAHVLERPAYREKARRLAGKAHRFVTPHDGLLFGEGHPRDGRSDMDALPVDAGYNVEESIPALLYYARLADDPEIERLARELMRRHLLFFLPDGALDNSWGTRNFKWSYWGSRTADGAIPALLMLAKGEPLFAAAAERQLQLLRDCTHEGLLYGGPHAAAHGALPCLHHTFCHAKSLATVIDECLAPASALVGATDLPRSQAAAWHWLRDLRTGLVRHHGWLATFTAYDWMYRPDTHATGGMPSLLWHQDTGPLLAAGLSREQPLEPHNTQENHEALKMLPTPRLETGSGSEISGSHRDGRAHLDAVAEQGVVDVVASGHMLISTSDTPIPGETATYRVACRFDHAVLRIAAQTSAPQPACWVLPLISERTERIVRRHDNAIEIHKRDAVVSVTSSHPLTIQGGDTQRAYNPVPGFEILPLTATAPAAAERIEIVIAVHRHLHSA